MIEGEYGNQITVGRVPADQLRMLAEILELHRRPPASPTRCRGGIASCCLSLRVAKHIVATCPFSKCDCQIRSQLRK